MTWNCALILILIIIIIIIIMLNKEVSYPGKD